MSEIPYVAPSHSMILKMVDANTLFSGFQIRGEVYDETSRSFNSQIELLTDFNGFTSAEKTAILKWEKTKVAKMMNAALAFWIQGYTPLIYSDIPTSFFQ